MISNFGYGTQQNQNKRGPMTLGAKKIPPRPPARANVLQSPFGQGNMPQDANNTAIPFDDHNEDEIFTADPMPDNNLNDPQIAEPMAEQTHQFVPARQAPAPRQPGSIRPRMPARPKQQAFVPVNMGATPPSRPMNRAQSEANGQRPHPNAHLFQNAQTNFDDGIQNLDDGQFDGGRVDTESGDSQGDVMEVQNLNQPTKQPISSPFGNAPQAQETPQRPSSEEPPLLEGKQLAQMTRL